MRTLIQIELISKFASHYVNGLSWQSFLSIHERNWEVASRILSNSVALSNSTISLIIPPGFFAFKIYSRLSNSPAWGFAIYLFKSLFTVGIQK